MVEIIIEREKLVLGISITCVVCVALGIGIAWAFPHLVTPSPHLDIQNQTMVQRNEDQVRELQSTITNLTAEVQKYKEQLKECDRNLSRSIEQIQEYKEQLKECDRNLSRSIEQLQTKTEEINQCKLEREKCNQAGNHVGTIHKKHPWWLMVAVFSAVLSSLQYI